MIAVLEERTEERLDRVRALGSSLRAKFERHAAMRAEIEQRWLEDLCQYHGRYDKDTTIRLQKDTTGGSKIFVNLTRPRCRTFIARFMEMAFPADDRNFEIDPTPVPEMMAPGDYEMAKEHAKAMQKQIDDQLIECHYQNQARIAATWMTLLGIGILKGPLIEAKVENTWQALDEVNYVLAQRLTRQPTIKAISPFDFFPDMNATKLEECEFFYERRYVGRKHLRNLAKNPLYDADAIRRALRESPRGTGHRNYVQQELRAFTGAGATSFDDNLYELIEYRGPIEPEDAAALQIEMEFNDPLVRPEVVIEMVGDAIIRAQMHPLETQEMLYSTINLIEDEGSIFGYGLPSMIRSPQIAVNTSWRMLLDDSNFSIGSQLVIRREIVTPADGEYAFSPRKIWYLDDPLADIRQSFYNFQVDNHQPFLMSIFQAAKQLIDEESQIPSLMQGEIGNTPIQTASGMSMMTNNATMTIRDVLKIWDQEITKPLITRFYDYNMQYSQNPAIKGDFKIHPRCSSVLMVKETQVPSLIQLGNLSQQPGFASYAKFPEILRALVEAMRLSADKLVKTDEEIQSEAEMQQPVEQQQDPMVAAKQQEMALKDAAQLQKNQLDYQMHAEKIASVERIKAMEANDRAQQRQFDLIRGGMESELSRQEMALKRVMGSGI